MKLYYAKSACSLTIRIMINEVNVPCEFVSVDLKAKKTEHGEDYFSINPKGAVPALQLDDDTVLTEVAVISQYLAETEKRSDLLPPVGGMTRYHVLEWENYVATELHKGIGILFNPKLTQDMKDTIFIPMIQTKLDFLNKHLGAHPFLVGKSFMLPDAYCFVILNWLKHFNIDMKSWVNVAKYFDAVKTRPSVKKSLEQEGL